MTPGKQASGFCISTFLLRLAICAFLGKLCHAINDNKIHFSDEEAKRMFPNKDFYCNIHKNHTLCLYQVKKRGENVDKTLLVYSVYKSTAITYGNLILYHNLQMYAFLAFAS